MKIFEDKILKEEERLSGFNPGEPDDDIFLLESKGKYEGAVPRYEEEAPAAEEVNTLEAGLESLPEEMPMFDEPAGENAPEEEAVGAEGSAWDDFWAKESGEGGEEEFPEAIEEPEGDILTAESSAPAATEEPDRAPFEASEEEEIPDYAISAAESFAREGEEKIIEESTVQEQSEINMPPAPAFEIDEDFREMLRSELNASKRREKKAESYSQQPPTDFKPVEEVTETNYIDITNFDMGKPSTSGIEQAAPAAEMTPAPEPGENLEKEKAAASGSGAEGEASVAKAPRKKSAGRKIAVIAASIILGLGAIGTGGYYFLQKMATPKSGKDQATAVKTIATAKHEPRPVVKPEVQKPAEPKPAETKPAGPKPETVSPKPREQQAAAPSVEIVKVEPKKAAAPKPKAAPTKIASAAAQKKVKAVAQAPRTGTRPAAAPKAQPVAAPVAKNVPKAEQKAAADKSKSSGEIYSIQIYSSPSREDAEEWRQKLERKNVRNAIISSQKVRDKVWYRVRFGEFKTKEEARSAALKYGFDQSWIDRIK